MDTLDYSGTGLNTGSKVVFAAYGQKLRKLTSELPNCFHNLSGVKAAALAQNGVVALSMAAFETYEKAIVEMGLLNQQLATQKEALGQTALIIVGDDADFIADALNNFLWVSFTRCNPSHDIYGVDSFTKNKHWGCNGPLIIDARIKPHHAPPLVLDPAIEQKINRLWEKGGSLYEWSNKH